MRIIDRFDKYMVHYNLNDNQVTVNCGLSVGLLGKARRGDSDLGKKAIDKILNFYQDINRVWLLTGEGEMLNTPMASGGKSTPDKMIPFYDAQAVAGNSYEMEMSAYTRPSKMIRMGDFLNDSEAAIRVFGNSMTPNYPAGCIVGTKLHTDSFIEPGTVYIIETRYNRYLKRLYYCEEEDCFECVSDNHMVCEEGSRKGKPYYPAFKIPFSEVVRLHRVTGVIKRNIL